LIYFVDIAIRSVSRISSAIVKNTIKSMFTTMTIIYIYSYMTATSTFTNIANVTVHGTEV